MKKKVLFAIVSAMVISLTACNSAAPEKATAATTTTTAATQQITQSVEEEILGEDVLGGDNVLGGDVQIPSPWVEHTSVEEMAAALEFEIAFPETADGLPITYIQEMETLAEVRYSDDGREITIRKGIGSDDVSGIYNTYSEEKMLEVGGKAVTVKGDNGIINLAVWSDGEFSYSIFSTGISDEAATEIVSAMQ